MRKANGELVRELAALKEAGRAPGSAAPAARTDSVSGVRPEVRTRRDPELEPPAAWLHDGPIGGVALERRFATQPGRLEQLRGTWHEHGALRRVWLLRGRSVVAEWFGIADAVCVASNGVEVWSYGLAPESDGTKRSLSVRFTVTGLMDIGG